MKTRLLTLCMLLALCLSTKAQAQAQLTLPPAVKPTNFIQGDFVKVSKEFSTTAQRSRSLTDGIQEPKWLTNLPCDSSIYKIKMYGFSDNCDAWYSTMMNEDLTGRFVGNTVTTIKTYVPAGGYNLSFYIMDNDTGDMLWSAYIGNGYPADVMVDIPCDWVVDKPRNLQVGFQLSFDSKNAGGPAEIYLGCVPCFRDYTWLIQSNSVDFTAGQVYNYSIYPMYTMRKSTYFGLPFYLVTEGEAGLNNNGIEFSGVSHSRVFMGEKADFKTTFVNFGCMPIHSASFESRCGDNVTVYEHDKAIPYLGSGSFETKISTENAAARLPLSVKLLQVNGEVPTDNIVAEGSITTVDPEKQVERTVVMEEFTGTWCGWCPRGQVAIDLLSEEYGKKFIPIAVHSGDNMQAADFNDVLAYFAGTGFPYCNLNRAVYGDPYGGSRGGDMGIDNDVNDIFARPTEATLSIDNMSLSEDKKTINITTSTSFSINCDDTPYGISYVLTEDGITGSQYNYFAMYASDYAKNPYLGHLTKLGTYYKATFNHVGRALYGTWGVEGSLSGAIVPGETKTHTYDIVVPENIKDINNVHVVAMLVDNKTGEIINAASMKVADVTAIKNVFGNNQAATINVEAGSLHISAANAVATVYTADGRTVVSRNVNGNIGLHLPSGSYIVRVDDGKNTTVKKVQF